jgi:hypothetical protein
VTALLVQDLCGGELMRGMVAGKSHYWNHLPSGEEMDLTREQFPRHTEPQDVTVSDRTYVLSSRETELRYNTLRRRYKEFSDGADSLTTLSVTP